MEYRNYISGLLPIKWPYDVAYEKETVEECDVLVVGGGTAGAFAAIRMNHPLNQRIAWKRKATGEIFRVKYSYMK